MIKIIGRVQLPNRPRNQTSTLPKQSLGIQINQYIKRNYTPCRFHDSDESASMSQSLEIRDLQLRLHNKEVELCTSNSILYQVYTGEKLSKDDQIMLESIIKAHKEHRMGDLLHQQKHYQQLLDNLIKQSQKLDDDIHNTPNKLQAQKENITERIEKVNTLIEQINSRINNPDSVRFMNRSLD